MMMNSGEKMKKKPPKDSLTLLPCFYFVEVRGSCSFNCHISLCASLQQHGEFYDRKLDWQMCVPDQIFMSFVNDF